MGKKVNKRFLGVFMVLNDPVTYLVFARLKSPGLHINFYMEDTPNPWSLFYELLSVLSVWDEAIKTAYTVSGCKTHLNSYSTPPEIPGSCSILNYLLFVNSDTLPLMDSNSQVASKGDEQLSGHFLTISLPFPVF